MNREQAIEILQRMSKDGFYGNHVHEALRMGVEALEKQNTNKFAPQVFPCSAAWFEDGEEKQKEQKPNPLCGSTEEYYREAYYDQPEKEQKPGDCIYAWVPSVEHCKYCSARCNTRITDEQKPAEKQVYTGLTDLEKTIHRGFLAAGVENVPVTIIKETAQECLAHIDKPAKWSEEDEFFFDCLVDKIEINKDSCGLTMEEVRFLRNLRSRPIKADNWKPTEEQMEALDNARFCKVYDRSELDSLYENLKRL